MAPWPKFVTGPFGELHTEAAVSPNLSKSYLYLFSNQSSKLLKEMGLSYGDGIVQAPTLSFFYLTLTKRVFMHLSSCVGEGGKFSSVWWGVDIAGVV